MALARRIKQSRGSPDILRKGGVHSDQPKRGQRPRYEPTIEEQLELEEYLNQEYEESLLDAFGDE